MPVATLALLCAAARASAPPPDCVQPWMLAPIPCRDDLAHVAERLFSRIGRAAEVGVFQGNFSAQNLLQWKGEYVAVDSWNFRPGDPKDRDKNFKSEATNLRNWKHLETSWKNHENPGKALQGGMRRYDGGRKLMKKEKMEKIE